MVTATIIRGQCPEVSLEATQRAMEELIQPGKRPHGKLAFWNAAVSIRTKLSVNCAWADTLRAYADKPLPVNHDELRAMLPGIMSRQLETLYSIEHLWNTGVIHFNCGHDLASQLAWRNSMCAAIPGMGLKTVSFALHIYAPASCLLLAIDCWHIRRIQGVGGNEALKDARYLEFEQVLRHDCETLRGYEPGYWFVTYAACLWERTRQHYGASEAHSGGYQSHKGLSCYV